MTYNPFNVKPSSGIPLAYQASTHDPGEAGPMDPSECEGHESLDGAHMGETVYCDGSCL